MTSQTKRCTAAVLASIALAWALVSCGGGKATTAQQRPVPPAPPTASSPNPAYIAQTAADAIRLATPYLAGAGGTAHSARHITLVAYVQTTARQIATVMGFGPGVTGADLYPDAKAWLFIEHGVFREIDYGDGALTPYQQPTLPTLWVVINSEIPAPSVGEDTRPDDLAQLGSPTVIPPGQVPQIDAVRAPLAPAGSAAIAVGAPSLVGGKVQMPVNTMGSGLSAYTGFNIHLRWDASIFAYSSVNATGGVIPSPVCLASADADGAGEIYSCSSVGGGQTSAAGLLATFVLTPTGSGCSPLHLFTDGGADGGNSTTGTYTIDAVTGAPQIVATSDGSANQAGQGC